MSCSQHGSSFHDQCGECKARKAARDDAYARLKAGDARVSNNLEQRLGAAVERCGGDPYTHKSPWSNRPRRKPSRMVCRLPTGGDCPHPTPDWAPCPKSCAHYRKPVKPLAENLATLEAWLRERRCYIGIGADADGFSCGYYRRPTSDNADEEMPFAVGSSPIEQTARADAAIEAANAAAPGAGRGE